MRIFHDWEFLELGPDEPVRPLSAGLAREDGAELYIVIKNRPALKQAMEKHPWLCENVLPYLPVKDTGCFSYPEFDPDHPDASFIREPAMAAALIRQFVLGEGMFPYQPEGEWDDSVELWGWYSSYDHVCLSQMFGTMAQLPAGFPMYTHDLKQECDRLGIAGLPRMPGAREHHALDDAKEVRWRFAHLGEWFSTDPHTGLSRPEGHVYIETHKSAGNSA